MAEVTIIGRVRPNEVETKIDGERTTRADGSGTSMQAPKGMTREFVGAVGQRRESGGCVTTMLPRNESAPPPRNIVGSDTATNTRDVRSEIIALQHGVTREQAISTRETLKEMGWSEERIGNLKVIVTDMKDEGEEDASAKRFSLLELD